MSAQPVPTALSRGPCPSFPELAGRYLEEYLHKIRYAVQQLDAEQLWWCPSPGDTNSVGNLVLHLCGNLSLWIGQEIGGEAFDRDRAGEFTARRSHSAEELLAELTAVVARCRRALEAQQSEPLERRLDVQTYHTDALGVIFHAVEHMAYHTGQILFITKQLRGAGHGIELYPQHSGE